MKAVAVGDGAQHAARRVTWLELFFDLIFVAAVAQVGKPLHHDYSVEGAARYAVLFVLIWCAWTGQALFMTRFGTDTIVQRGLTLLQIFAAAAMAANAAESLDSRSAAGFAAAYAAMRFLLVAQYWRARRIVGARQLATQYLVGHGIAALVWLTSAVVPAPARFVLWAAALLLDLATPWLGRTHDVSIPPHAAHLPERFGLFTLILLGETVIAVMHGMESQEDWTVAAATSAFTAMAIAFMLWWWYFDGAFGASERHVRSHRDAVRFQIWSYAHLPLCLGIALTGIGLQHLVHLADAAALPAKDVSILAMSMAGTMAALIVIGSTARRVRPSDRLIFQVLLSAAALSLAFLGDRNVPVVVVLLLAALCAMQLLATTGRLDPLRPPRLLPAFPRSPSLESTRRATTPGMDNRGA